MDQIPFQGDSGDLQEWQDWATKEMDRLIGRILELEDQLRDACLRLREADVQNQQM